MQSSVLYLCITSCVSNFTLMHPMPGLEWCSCCKKTFAKPPWDDYKRQIANQNVWSCGILQMSGDSPNILAYQLNFGRTITCLNYTTKNLSKMWEVIFYRLIGKIVKKIQIWNTFSYYNVQRAWHKKYFDSFRTYFNLTKNNTIKLHRVKKFQQMYPMELNLV